jgi:hypothetical protein
LAVSTLAISAHGVFWAAGATDWSAQVDFLATWVATAFVLQVSLDAVQSDCAQVGTIRQAKATKE